MRHRHSVQAALEGLTNIPNITVSVRTPEGFNGNKSWFVSFTSLANAGDMPMLGIDTSQLVGTDVNAKVSEYLKGDSLGIRSLEILNANAGDTFALEFNYTWPDAYYTNKSDPSTRRDGHIVTVTRNLSAFASASEVQEAVSNLVGFGSRVRNLHR